MIQDSQLVGHQSCANYTKVCSFGFGGAPAAPAHVYKVALFKKILCSFLKTAHLSSVVWFNSVLSVSALINSLKQEETLVLKVFGEKIQRPFLSRRDVELVYEILKDTFC